MIKSSCLSKSVFNTFQAGFYLNKLIFVSTKEQIKNV
jgi:hypothetical protein